MNQPDRTSIAYIRKIWPKRRSPLRAIRDKCMDCTADQPKEIGECPSANCPLWPFRMGKNPYIEFSPRGLEVKRQRAAAMNAVRKQKSDSN